MTLTPSAAHRPLIKFVGKRIAAATAGSLKINTENFLVKSTESRDAISDFDRGGNKPASQKKIPRSHLSLAEIECIQVRRKPASFH
jgi:hypothetical protein